ncbi:MAG: hypothetical protein WC531_03790 [Candidatus Paceibacterota bacterium]|jgi:hypothetical protein
MTPRLSLTLLALLLAIVLPWWASGFILLLFIFLYPWYYEAVLVMVVYELLYGLGPFWLSLALLLIIPLIEALKKRLYVFN